MVFTKCTPNFRAKAAAKRQALKQKLAGVGAYHGVSLRLLLVDKQIDAQGVLPNAALDCVHVVKYDAKETTLAELVGLIREAHCQNGAPFLSIAIAQHGADGDGQWEWTTDLTVNLKSMHGAIDQLAPVIEVLAAALSKTKAGKAHIDLLACNLATTCKGLIPALEKMYGIDFRASTDETGNDLSGGDWKMETDNDYDVAADYLDAAKLAQYTETMAKVGKAIARASRSLTAAGRAENHRRDVAKGKAGLLGASPSNITTGAAANAAAERSGGTLNLTAQASVQANYAATAQTAGTAYGTKYDLSAEFAAQALAEANVTAMFGRDGAHLDAHMQALITADAKATGTFVSNLGAVEAQATASAALEAFARANASVGPDGAKITLGAKIGATVRVGGTFTYTSPSGAVRIRAALTAEAGFSVGAAFTAGVTWNRGAVTFAGQLDLTVAAGGSVDLEVTFDTGAFANTVRQQVAALRSKYDKLKPEDRQALLQIGTARSDDKWKAFDFQFESNEIDVLALAATARALMRSR